MLGHTGRPTESLAAYEKARAIQQKLADANPNVTQFQSELARIHNNIGMLFSETGKPAEALAALEKGRAIRQALADANPRVTHVPARPGDFTVDDRTIASSRGPGGRGGRDLP